MANKLVVKSVSTNQKVPFDINVKVNDEGYDISTNLSQMAKDIQSLKQRPSGSGESIQGPRGFQGLTGAQGPRGESIQGLQGLQGKSIQGQKGAQGNPGSTGPRGIQGLTGIQGLVGFQGLMGIQGPAGSGGSGEGLPIDNPWKEKRYIAIGDSLTDASVNISGDQKYCALIADTLGMTLTNIGVSGMTMSWISQTTYCTNTTFTDISNPGGVPRSFIYELINCKTQGTAFNDGKCPGLIDWTQYDLATIMLGANDALHFLASAVGETADQKKASREALIGELKSNNNWISTFYYNPDHVPVINYLNTFYGAYEMAIGSILCANPNIRIVLCTPPNTASYLRNYIVPAIYELGRKYSCPVIDFFSETNIPFQAVQNTTNQPNQGNDYQSVFGYDRVGPQYDYVHVNEAAHQRMAELAVARLLDIDPGFGGSSGSGGSGAQGTTGAQGIQGLQGPAGSGGSGTGTQGIQGIQGPAGSGGSAQGIQVKVINEGDPEPNDTLCFFTHSPLQGVGDYNTLLRQGWIDIAETPGEEVFSWNKKNYLALGDSLTDSNAVTNPKYCKIVADALGMNLDNAGVMGSTMSDNGKYTYPITRPRIPSQNRSFIHELAPMGDTIADDSLRLEVRGPYSIIDWMQYHLISIMLGTNDLTNLGYGTSLGTITNTVHSPSDTVYSDRNRGSYYNDYEEAILNILYKKDPDAILLLCIPPTNFHSHANSSGVEDGFIHDVFNRRISGQNMYDRIVALYNKYKNAGHNIELVNFYGEVQGDTVISTVVEQSYTDFVDAVHLTNAGQQKLANVLESKLNQIANSKNSLRSSGVTRHYYDPSNLYKIYGDGSFDILENSQSAGQWTEVRGNQIYYNYYDKNGIRRTKPTEMKNYGNLVLEHTVKYATTCDQARFNFKVDGPFFANSTEVTLTWDSQDIEVYLVEGVTTESLYKPSFVSNNNYTPTKCIPQLRQLVSGETFSFNKDNFYKIKSILVNRLYTNYSDLETPLDVYLNFSTPIEQKSVKFKFSKCRLFYKDGNSNPTGEGDILDSMSVGQTLGKNYTNSNNIQVLKDIYIYRDTNYFILGSNIGNKGWWTWPFELNINQLERNFLYVKAISNDPTKPLLLLATRYTEVNGTKVYWSNVNPSTGRDSVAAIGLPKGTYYYSNNDRDSDETLDILNDYSLSGYKIENLILQDYRPQVNSNNLAFENDGPNLHLPIELGKDSGYMYYYITEIGLLTLEDPFDV